MVVCFYKYSDYLGVFGYMTKLEIVRHLNIFLEFETLAKNQDCHNPYSAAHVREIRYNWL